MSKQSIQDVMDAMLPPPTEDNDSPRLLEYLNACLRATDVLGVVTMLDSGSRLDRALYIRNVVGQRLSDISAFVVRAGSAGLFVSSDPVPELRRMNAGRRVGREIPDAPDGYRELTETLTTLSSLVGREQSGTLTLDRDPRIQVGSVEISFDGIDGLPSDVFDADSLKRQQALDQLARLDFTKRRVRVLFVSEYEHDGRVDLVVGWRKIRDATGYFMSFRDVFDDSVVTSDVGSRDLDLPESDVLEFYRKTLAPLIGPRVRERDVALFRVGDVGRNRLYSFRVSAYQRVSSSRNDLFRAVVSRLTMSSSQLDELEALVSGFTADTQSVTPYPFLSELLYGTRGYGWVLAGLNLLSAFERGSDISTVRSYSYLGADLAGMTAAIRSGAFYVPSDISAFGDRLDASLSNFGLSATLGEVLEKCGVLLFFDEREGFDVDTPTLDREAALRETSAVAAVLAAVDSETATMDPALVRANMSVRPHRGEIASVSALVPNVPRLDTSDEPIDLLSFDGMGRVLDVIIDSSRRFR